MTRRALVAVGLLFAAFTGIGVAAAPPAHAACSVIPVGSPLPASFGEDPMIARLGLRRVWELATGDGVRVAVVDSGVDPTNPKVAAAITGPGAVIGHGTTEAPTTSEDCRNHGTPIAGIIAGRPTDDERVMGVAPDAQIVPIRFAGDIATTPEGDIAGAIRTAADQVGDRGVVNLSFAVPADRPAIRDAVAYALDHNVVVVAAAGNENETSPGLTWWPAAYPGVLAVASVDQQGLPAKDSNRGAWVDVAAPGVGLIAPSAGGGYATFDGTSFATAVVSGVAALVRDYYPGLSAADVVRRIEATAVSATGGRDERTGAGVVDPYLALTALDIPAVATELPSARGATIGLAPLPGGDDVLGQAGRIAAAGAAILLTLAAIVVLAGAATRRIAARRGDPAACERTAELHRGLDPVPVGRLDGADGP